MLYYQIHCSSYKPHLLWNVRTCQWTWCGVRRCLQGSNWPFCPWLPPTKAFFASYQVSYIFFLFKDSWHGSLFSPIFFTSFLSSFLVLPVPLVHPNHLHPLEPKQMSQESPTSPDKYPSSNPTLVRNLCSCPLGNKAQPCPLQASWAARAQP